MTAGVLTEQITICVFFIFIYRTSSGL